uniref:Uncharacterized protein n=1 Tax=Timema poppense TaxID=170557 RepID=A0A7R9GZ69_TIMPO|nr:unnamed protein product [Timema poppensis]
MHIVARPQILFAVSGDQSCRLACFLAPYVALVLQLNGKEKLRPESCKISAASTEPLTKIQAQDLILRLTDEERRALLSALQEFQSEKMKAEYEGQVIRTKEALDCDKTHTQIPSYSLTAVLFDTTGPRLSGSSLHLDLYCREHC